MTGSSETAQVSRAPEKTCSIIGMVSALWKKMATSPRLAGASGLKVTPVGRPIS